VRDWACVQAARRGVCGGGHGVSNIDSRSQDKQGSLYAELEPPASILWGSLNRYLEAPVRILEHPSQNALRALVLAFWTNSPRSRRTAAYSHLHMGVCSSA